MSILRRLLIILVIMSAGVQVLQAQTKGISTMEVDKMFQQEKIFSQAGSDQLLPKNSIPVGNVVEAENYYVGPGDVLAIQNLSFMAAIDKVIVSPETTVLIPRIGEISLKGKTLAEAREIIIQKMKDINPEVIAFVSLYMPRTVMVQVSGNVRHQGTYTFPASYRVSTALMIANQEKIDPKSISIPQTSALLRSVERKIDNDKKLSRGGIPIEGEYFRRNIAVIHKDGSSDNVDIELAEVTDNSKLDVFLREGDRIMVPYNKEDYELISISGEVLRPYVIVFKSGDKASHLLKMGAGLSKKADMANIYLIDGESKQKIKLDCDSKMNLSKDYDLTAGSAIIVGRKVRKKAKSKMGIVSVSGEVKSPGVYVIEPGKTKLSEIVETAGGFTNDAYLPLAYVTRNDGEKLSLINARRDLMEKFQYSDLTLEDTTRFQLDMHLRQSMVSCDLNKLFEQNRKDYDIVLNDKDMVVIPDKPSSVYVFGQVNQPGYVEFKENQTMAYYISKAGGYAEGAVESRARIIRGKTRVWVKGGEEVIVYAGDEIYVARTPDVPPGVELQKWAAIAGVLGALATVVNVTFFIISQK